MRASTRRMFSFLVSMVFIFGGMIIYGMMVIPSYDRIQELRATQLSREQFFNDQESVFKQIDGLLTNYKGNGSAQDAVTLSLPNEAQVSQVLGNIQSLAFLNNITLAAAQTEILPFQVPVGAPSYIKNRGAVKITIGATGNYQDFKKMLSQIETNVRIMDVKQMTIKTGAGAASADKLQYSFIVNAYYQQAAPHK